MLRSEEHLGPALRGRSRRSSWRAGTSCPMRSCPGQSVADEARRQGVSEAEVVWDLCGRHPEPPRPCRSAPQAPPELASVGRRSPSPLLRPSLPSATIVADPLRDHVGLAAGVGVEAVADRRGDVEPDEVEQLQRSHRMAGAELHAGVEVAGVEVPVVSISRTASNRAGKSSRLTTKPGLSGTSTAVLPSAAHHARARSADAVREARAGSRARSAPSWSRG